MARGVRKLIEDAVPSPLLTALLSVYHYALAALGAILYNLPSREILTIGVTGTKGKTSVTEMLNAILEEAGYTTALMNSIRFKSAGKSKPNLTRMSMAGRMSIQKFLRSAVDAGCAVAILEMTSEGARQHRQRFIDLDALVFTNLAPEHIESHGSYEAYRDAKFEIGRQLARSRKRPRTMAANADDRESARYLTLPVENALPFTLSSHQPYGADEHGGFFTFDDTKISIHLPGDFSLKNALAAAVVARALGISGSTIARALDKLQTIPGRAEEVQAGQEFTVVVDYAHTPDSLKAIYDAYTSPSMALGTKRKLICVLGATGGGRDTWKRPVMGRIAGGYCDAVILTDEDPYDEDPQKILEDVAHGMPVRAGGGKRPEIIVDRRLAMRRAFELAREFTLRPFDKTQGRPEELEGRQARGNQNGVTVLITGKGTDPSVCGKNGLRTPWSDAGVAREELERLLKAPGI